MLATPAVPAVTTPVEASTEAMVALLLVHVPPEVVDDRVEVAPEQIDVLPDTVPGVGLTVSMAELMQPVEVSLKLITELPASSAVTAPEEEPMMATDPLLLVHVPVPDALVSVVVVPEQSVREPPIAAGSATTVTVRVATQPSADVNVIVVVPAATPVTMPVVASTPAIAVLALPQVPDAVLVTVVDAPWHIEAVPPIAGGSALTVTTRVAEAVPQLLEMVYVSVVVPTEDPVTTPDVNPTAATVVLPLTHVPPVTVLLSVIVEPLHKDDGPLREPADAEVVTITLVVVITEPHVPVTV